MSRGLMLTPPRMVAVARALSQLHAMPEPPAGSPIDAGGRPINYRLEGGFNGGFDPKAPHCASWSYNYRVPTADCIGFMLWAAGIDRMQPSFTGSRGVWLNCASLLDDADSAKPRFCRTLAKGESPRAGDWVLTRDHCAMLIRPDGVDNEPLVIDCSPRHGRKNAIGTGGLWSGECRYIRPLVYAPEQT